ncbi:hypothetical protein HK101_011925 [Irineochytrium annulatum]|nr:hypothetical protein HK101_011925 [Irineochytrium annulatum]
MIRAARILMFFRRQEKKLHANFTVQITKFAAYLITLTHSIACMWFAVACPRGAASSCVTPSWALRGPGTDGLDPLFDQKGYTHGLGSLYVVSVYWTVTTMTTTGYGDITPQNDGERVFALISMTTGVFFYAYVSGTIASALSNMDSRRVSYSQKMDAVKQYMSDRDMDSDMQERVLDYYDYMWERNKGIDVKNLFEDMPSTFKSEVALSLNNAIIEKVKKTATLGKARMVLTLHFQANIFHSTSIGFRRMIAISMKLYLFTANEYVVHRGDLGLEMYFITQGRIDIYSSEEIKKPTASLIEGAHFVYAFSSGEFQIILGQRHEYSARAVCNTDIYVLLKKDIELAFEAYPQDCELVRAATEQRYTAAKSARKSRMAAMKSNDVDLEDEFGHGSAPPTQPHYASGMIDQTDGANGSTVNAKHLSHIAQGKRKMSVASAGFLIRDKAVTSTGSLRDADKMGSMDGVNGQSGSGNADGEQLKSRKKGLNEKMRGSIGSKFLSHGSVADDNAENKMPPLDLTRSAAAVQSGAVGQQQQVGAERARSTPGSVEIRINGSGSDDHIKSGNNVAERVAPILEKTDSENVEAAEENPAAPRDE